MTIAVACGLIILVLLVIMLLAGVPIAVALAVSSIGAILPVLDTGASVLTGAQRIFSGISVFSLLAIPFFILAGNLMNQGGIAKRLVDFVMAILGKLPGALLVTNVGANALFGAISGSASAAAAAVGSMVEKGEEEQGYDKALCAANPALQCPDHLFSGSRRHLCGSTLYGRLYSGHHLGGGLYGSCCDHFKEKRL